ncbi:MAG: thioredoxin [Gemmatimonadetes bacterium GWC2_71_10]|nr:MAG: thioredoxin [Gemmatimonadetes bacterium GWC2_71_10]
MVDTNGARHVTVACVFCETLNRVNLAKADAGPKCGACGRPILLDRPLRVGDAVFDRVIADAEVPVVVDFYADWCGPCKVMAPVFDELAAELAGQALVLKLDTDRNQQTAMKFNVRGIPTLIVFKGGKETGRQVGVAPKQKLLELLTPS